MFQIFLEINSTPLGTDMGSFLRRLLFVFATTSLEELSRCSCPSLRFWPTLASGWLLLRLGNILRGCLRWLLFWKFCLISPVVLWGHSLVHLLSSQTDTALCTCTAHHLPLCNFLSLHIMLGVFWIVSDVMNLVGSCILVHLPMACHKSSHSCWMVTVLSVLFKVVHSCGG